MSSLRSVYCQYSRSFHSRRWTYPRDNIDAQLPILVQGLEALNGRLCPDLNIALAFHSIQQCPDHLLQPVPE